jgi:hypothetical protein
MRKAPPPRSRGAPNVSGWAAKATHRRLTSGVKATRPWLTSGSKATRRRHRSVTLTHQFFLQQNQLLLKKRPAGGSIRGKTLLFIVPTVRALHDCPQGAFEGARHRAAAPQRLSPPRGRPPQTWRGRRRHPPPRMPLTDLHRRAKPGFLPLKGPRHDEARRHR